MTSAPRRVYVDWARGVAVLVMIQAHTFDAWTRIADRQTAFYRWAMVFGGIAAPLFLFLAGLAVALSAASVCRRGGTPLAGVEAVVKRGLEIFLLAFLFRLQALVITPGGPLVNLFRVDILNVIGPAMVLAGLVWGAAKTSGCRVAAFAVLAAAIALATPAVRLWPGVDRLPTFFQWYLRPFGEQTTFTLLPWVGFAMAGAAVGTLIDAARSTKQETRVHIGCAVGGALLVALGLVTATQPTIYQQSYFWTTSPTFFSIRTGTMMLTLSACYWVARAAAPAGTDPLTVLGRGSLFVYWIHVELAYGYLTWPIRRKLTPSQVVVAYAVFSVLMYLALLTKNRIVDRRRLGAGGRA